MTKQDKLKNMLKDRNPLLSTKREAVTPVDLYQPEVVASKPVNQQTTKEVNYQTSEQAKEQANKPTNEPTSKVVEEQVSKQTKKFASYLTPVSIKALKQIALDTNRKDYEVLQEAVEAYLASIKRAGDMSPNR